MAEPRVAVVVTCFNDGLTLDETIASMRHVREELELVIVDDGSTDTETLNLLAEYEHEGLRVIHQANRGQAAAAMAGVAATKAHYVMRFDADDLIEPDGPVALADALDSAPNAAAAWGDVQTFGITTFRIPGVRALDPWLVTYTNVLTGSGNLLRRARLKEAGGWQLHEGYEDWDLWMSLAERGHGGVYVPRVIFRHRRDRTGRNVGTHARATEYYAVVRERHRQLFAARAQNRRRSKAPGILKVSAAAVEAVPGVPRLTKIHLCELFARLFWGGGARATIAMAVQAAQIRLRRR